MAKTSLTLMIPRFHPYCEVCVTFVQGIVKRTACVSARNMTLLRFHEMLNFIFIYEDYGEIKFCYNDHVDFSDIFLL